jgi:hypothetical protein
MVDFKQNSGSKPKPNYADLPQRPITLKKSIGGLARPKARSAAIVQNKAAPPSPAPSKKPVSQKKSVSGGQWTLRGVSPDARELAVKLARDEGVKLHEWIEQAIYRAASPAPEPISEPEPVVEISTDDAATLEALQDIRERLVRIEEQSGLFYRFWQRVKEAMTPPD